MQTLNWNELKVLNQNLNKFGKDRLTANFPPECGWIKFMREVLGMSRRNLATLMDIKISNIRRDERREIQGQIRLAELEEYAKPLYCRLTWTSLPEQIFSEPLNKNQIHNWKIEQIDEFITDKGGTFVYALIPKTSIEKIRERQATRVAIKVLNSANELMILENQGIPNELLREQKKLLAKKLKKTRRKLWVKHK